MKMTENRGNLTQKCGKGTLIYATDCVLNCLAVNPKAEMLAIAGRNCFQVLVINEDKFVHLPKNKPSSRIYVESPPNSPASQVSDTTQTTPNAAVTAVQPIATPRSHSVTDVAWSCADDILATASTGGDITLWDTSRGMSQITCFSGHTRSIHCLTFHPSNPTELITASQDGKIKLFDARDANLGNPRGIFFQRTTSPSPVRDIAYCPRQPTLFASAQENGIVSIWDTRQIARPFRAFQGHSCPIGTLDWHPNWQGSGRNWLATAGAVDHLIKVWNFSQSAPGQSNCPSLVYSVRTSNVNRIRWRPSFTTQIVSTCNQTFDLSAYLWDLRRPFMPYASFEEHKGIVTSIAWSPSETDYFYTVGRDGLLIRHCVADGLRPAENASPVALSISVQGQLAHAVSRDRALATKPPPVVDETNLVTQSPFYRAVKSSSNSLNAGSSLPCGLTEGPPGFYAAPSSESPEQFSNSSPGNISLPQMGSLHSAELFVSQAQSLLFSFKPSIDSLRHPDWTSLGSALIPNLVIALAKNYEFVGPNVNSICRHNAVVALRFGQSFLVQFWSMLRCLYGTSSMTKRRPSTGSLLAVSKPPHTNSEVLLKRSRAKRHDVSTKTDDKLCALGATTPDSGSDIRVDVSNGMQMTVGSSAPGVLHDRQPAMKSNLRLLDVLNALGVETGVVRSDSRLYSQPSEYSARRGLAHQISRGRRFSVESGSIKKETSRRLPLIELSHSTSVHEFSTRYHTTSGLVGDSAELWNVDGSATNRESDLPSPRHGHHRDQEDGSQFGREEHFVRSSATLSSTIPILTRREDDRTKRVYSPISGQQFATSVSSVQTCDSLGEPVDFLFHYSDTVTESAVSPVIPPTLPEFADKAANDGTKSPTHAQDDVVEVLGVPDDPVIMETNYIPDEAFQPPPVDKRSLCGGSFTSKDVHSDFTKDHVSLADQRDSRSCAADRTIQSERQTIPQSWRRRGKTGARNSKPKLQDRLSQQSEIGELPVKSSTGENLTQTKPSSTVPATTDDRAVRILAPFRSSSGFASQFNDQLLLLDAPKLPHIPDATPLVMQWFYDLVEAGHVQTVCTALLALGPERLHLREWIPEARVESWFTSYLELLSRFRLWTTCARIIKQCGSSKGGVDNFPYYKEVRRTLTHQNTARGLRAQENEGRKTNTGGSDSKSGDTPARCRWKSGSTGGGATLPSGGGFSAESALAPSVAALNQASTTLSIRCGQCCKPLFANEATQQLTGHAGWACSRHSSTADPANVTCAVCHLTVRGLFVWCRGCSHGGHLAHIQMWLSQRTDCPAGCGHRCEYQ